MFYSGVNGDPQIIQIRKELLTGYPSNLCNLLNLWIGVSPAISVCEVSVVACDFPIEQDVFHAGAGADVMHDQVTL